MRKTTIILAVVALAAMFISSCKSHERCPAYGKTNQQNESVSKRV